MIANKLMKLQTFFFSTANDKEFSKILLGLRYKIMYIQKFKSFFSNFMFQI